MKKNKDIVNDAVLIRIIEAYQVGETYNKLMNILGKETQTQIKRSGNLIFISDEFGVEKTEMEYIRIIKELNDTNDEEDQLCMITLLFGLVRRLSNDSIRELFDYFHYNDPCGKTNMLAGKRLCVDLLENFCAKHDNILSDVAHILLRRIYDIEYMDGIFNNYLDESGLIERRKKHKLCFIIAEDGTDLSFLSQIKDITVTGIFIFKDMNIWHTLKNKIFFKSKSPKIEIITKKEWESPNDKIKNDFIEPKEVLYQIQQNSIISNRTFLSMEYIDTNYLDESLLNDYPVLHLSDFCIIYGDNPNELKRIIHNS